MKEDKLTSGYLYCVPPLAGLREPRGSLTAIQKSADGIVSAKKRGGEGLND